MNVKKRATNMRLQFSSERKKNDENCHKVGKKANGVALLQVDNTQPVSIFYRLEDRRVKRFHVPCCFRCAQLLNEKLSVVISGEYY